VATEPDRSSLILATGTKKNKLWKDHTRLFGSKRHPILQEAFEGIGYIHQFGHSWMIREKSCPDGNGPKISWEHSKKIHAISVVTVSETIHPDGGTPKLSKIRPLYYWNLLFRGPPISEPIQMFHNTIFFSSMSITLHRSHPDITKTSKNYPLVNCYTTMGTSAFFMGKVGKSTNFLWQFSMSKSVSLPEGMAHQTHYNPINFPLNHHFHRVFQRLSSKKHVSKGSRSWPTSRRRSMKNRNSPTSNACSSSFSRAPLTRALGQRGELPVTVAVGQRSAGMASEKIRSHWAYGFT